MREMRWFLLLTLSASAVWAQQFTSGDWTYTVNALDEATIIGYNGQGGDVSVPSDIGGYSVKQIGGGWPPVFAIGNTNIGRITVQNGVSRIGDWAFAYNYGLSSVSLPESAQTIGDWAFYSCHSLTAVVIPQGVTSVGDRAFTACYSLSTVGLPEALRTIGVLAFADCFSLTNISLPSSLETISAVAFFNCTNLTAVHLPENIQSIGDSAFAGAALTSVSLPASLTNVGTLAFGLALTNIFVDPLNANYASQNGILFDKGFSQLLIAPKSIAGHFIVPSTVTNIGAYAFAERTNLTQVTAPAGLKGIGDLAFYGCSALQGILFLGDAPSVGAEVFDYSPATVYWTMGHTGWGSDLGGRPTEMLSQLYTVAQYNANRTNGQTDVTTNPAAFNLFTQSQFAGNRTAGQQDVIGSPMAFGLYDSNSIMDLRMGGLMIQKQGTDAIVVFQPQTTIDLIRPFTNNGTPITNTIPMPGNKGFLRVGAVYVPTNDLVDPTPPPPVPPPTPPPSPPTPPPDQGDYG
jgi:hypothetical protein